MRDNNNFKRNDNKSGKSLGKVSGNSHRPARERGNSRDKGFDKPRDKESFDEEIEIPTDSLAIEGRNAVVEAFRSGKTIDKLYVLDGCTDGAVSTIRREAKKAGTIILR